jgi:hypothetical protein
MAKITPFREARFDEKNTQPMGRSGSTTPKKRGPAVKSSPPSPNGSFPNSPSHKGRGKV